ncbi:MAG: restriction endonuclease subunit S, partial [Phycisphaeraceae bacterium]
PPVPPSGAGAMKRDCSTNILGTLDDKIELNRRMNQTLEAMARAIFKSWFIDFDPVRAKVDGNPPPGLAPATAVRFPAAFQDSPLGPIPQGWEVRKLGDIVSVTRGRSYKSSELVECDTGLVTLKSFQRGGGYRPDGLKPYVGTYRAEQVVEPGELVEAQTDVTQQAEVIGQPAIVRGDPTYRTLVASLDTAIIRPVSEAVSVTFLYCLLRTDDFQAHAYSHSTGTTVLHLGKQAIPT